MKASNNGRFTFCILLRVKNISAHAANVSRSGRNGSEPIRSLERMCPQLWSTSFRVCGRTDRVVPIEIHGYRAYGEASTPVTDPWGHTSATDTMQYAGTRAAGCWACLTVKWASMRQKLVCHQTTVGSVVCRSYLAVGDLELGSKMWPLWRLGSADRIYVVFTCVFSYIMTSATCLKCIRLSAMKLSWMAHTCTTFSAA